MANSPPSLFSRCFRGLEVICSWGVLFEQEQLLFSKAKEVLQTVAGEVSFVDVFQAQFRPSFSDDDQPDGTGKDRFAFLIIADNPDQTKGVVFHRDTHGLVFAWHDHVRPGFQFDRVRLSPFRLDFQGHRFIWRGMSVSIGQFESFPLVFGAVRRIFLRWLQIVIECVRLPRARTTEIRLG